MSLTRTFSDLKTAIQELREEFGDDWFDDFDMNWKISFPDNNSTSVKLEQRKQKKKKGSIPKEEAKQEQREITIPCQRCTPESEGCYTCGGRRYVLSQRKACLKCERVAWFRPGVFTAYSGKTYHTYDGLLMFCHMKDGKFFELCVHCEAKETHATVSQLQAQESRF